MPLLNESKKRTTGKNFSDLTLFDPMLFDQFLNNLSQPDETRDLQRLSPFVSHVSSSSPGVLIAVEQFQELFEVGW